MVLAAKKAEISPCLGRSVLAHALWKRLSRRKEWCCGQDSGTAPSRGQYSRAATFLIAAGSFAEDVLVYVSASELSLGRWAQGDNSPSNLFASWPRFPSFPSLQLPKPANTTKPFAFILLPFIQTLLTPHLFFLHCWVSHSFQLPSLHPAATPPARIFLLCAAFTLCPHTFPPQSCHPSLQPLLLYLPSPITLLSTAFPCSLLGCWGQLCMPPSHSPTKQGLPLLLVRFHKHNLRCASQHILRGQNYRMYSEKKIKIKKCTLIPLQHERRQKK